MNFADPFTIGWIALGALALGLEGLALFNSRRGDTLSEHVWVFVGVRDGRWEQARQEPYPDEPPKVYPKTPKWTLRVARVSVLFFLVWLLLHFLTGGWV